MADGIARQVVDENRAVIAPKSAIAPDRDCAKQIIERMVLLFRGRDPEE